MFCRTKAMCTGSETDTSGFRSLDSVAPIVKVRRTNRCLFGRPDPEETLAMVRDELKRQQDNFFRRYIVVEEITDSTRNVNCIFERLGHRRPSRLRTTPYRQLLITDFWRKRKQESSLTNKAQGSQ